MEQQFPKSTKTNKFRMSSLRSLKFDFLINVVSGCCIVPVCSSASSLSISSNSPDGRLSPSNFQKIKKEEETELTEEEKREKEYELWIVSSQEVIEVRELRGLELIRKRKFDFIMSGGPEESLLGMETFRVC